MVQVLESKQAHKALDKAPKEILRSYETWVRMIESHGTAIVRKFPGYHDEALRGEWLGYRSSRLSLKWRVIYKVSHSGEIEVVHIARITAHDYRRK